MVKKNKNVPSNPNTLGIVGHLIISNKQIHKYQLSLLNNYLNSISIKYQETVVADILSGSTNAISFSKSLDAFHGESSDVQRALFYLCVSIAYADNQYIDEKERFLLKKISKQTTLSTEEKEKIENEAIANAMEFRDDNNNL